MQNSTTTSTAEGTEKALDNILSLIANGRILKAFELYDTFSKGGGEHHRAKNITEKLQKNSTQIQLLADRYFEIMKCLSSNEGLEWTLGSELGGLKAYYQVQPDGSISACVHGRQEDVPVFEQAVVMSDIERFCCWVPLFTQSNLITMPAQFEAIFQSTMSTPFLSRDAVIHMWTADCLTEHNTYVCFGKSVETFPGTTIPPINRTLFHDRAQVHSFSLRIKVINPTTIEIHSVINIHLNASLPQWLISFLMNNLLSIVMSVLKQQAIKMITDKDKFEGAIRAKSFPIISNYYLPRARELWIQNNWNSLTPSTSLDSEGQYLPPFLHSVVRQNNLQSSKTTDPSPATPSPSSPSPATPNRTIPPLIPKSSPSQKSHHYGILWKLGQGLLVDPWAQRFFILDFQSHTLTYYSFHSSLLSLATHSSTSPSAPFSNSLSTILLNDTKKIKKGEINLENKKILFYFNEKYSINWFNSNGDHGDRAVGTTNSNNGSFGSLDSTVIEPLHDSYIIEIIYMKSVTDSKRSNMILLTYNYQIGKEWAEMLTYACASATKIPSKRMITGGKTQQGQGPGSGQEGHDQENYEDLRDELRDSLASYHGIIPSPSSSPSSSSASASSDQNKLIQKKKKLVKKKVIFSTESPEKEVKEKERVRERVKDKDKDKVKDTEEEGQEEGEQDPSPLSSLISLPSLQSLTLPSFLSLLYEGLDLLVLSTASNLFDDLLVNKRIILFPFLVYLLPQRLQIPALILVIYILIYSNMGPLYQTKKKKQQKIS